MKPLFSETLLFWHFVRCRASTCDCKPILELRCVWTPTPRRYLLESWGAIVGAPAGFFLERLVNRARLKISYAETAYEDIYMFPEQVRQRMARHTDFIQFVSALVKWSLQQRLIGNLFTR